MKRLSVIVMAALAVVLAGCAGCRSAEGAGQVIGDYGTAGRTLGKATWYAYKFLKTDAKYAEYTAKAEDLYAMLDAGNADIGSVNTIALAVCKTALAAKYGEAKAELIADSILLGGAIADRIIEQRIDTDGVNKFIGNFKAAIDECRQAENKK